MARTLGIVILFQQRLFDGDLGQLAQQFGKLHVDRTDTDVTISETGNPDEPSISMYIERRPERLGVMVSKACRQAKAELVPAIARCDAMLVASWDRVHDVADLALEVSYIEPLFKGILYYVHIDELDGTGSFPQGAGLAARIPMSDADIARWLHGSWRLDPRVPCPVATPGRTAMTITASGDLVYSMVGEGGDIQRIQLTYRVDNGDLVTDQRSKPGEQRTPISLGGDRAYLRDLGGSCVFMRDPEPLDPDASLSALIGFALHHGVASATPGGAMSPFLAVETGDGKRMFIRFADAAPDSTTARAAAERAAAEMQGNAVRCVYATDAVLTIGGERIEAIVVEGSRVGRTGAIMAGLRYVADGDATRAEGTQIQLPDAPRSWL
ncbi:MAG: hypothetical protein ABI867_23790 [Kofleriaceae bacterium]